MAWCLVKSEATKFKRALKNGTIDPVKMAEMTSAQRRTFLSKIVSEDNAKRINALFESKLLLKDQKRGMITWAKRVVGITPETKRDLISRIERMQDILDPKDQFLNDLVAKRLGIEVTQQEANNIAKLSKRIEKYATMDKDGRFESESDRLAYGRAQVTMANYINKLKLAAEKPTLKEVITDPVKAVSTVAGEAKAIRASMDNSAIFRQGWKTLWTHPKVWWRNARKSFRDIWQTFGQDRVLDDLNADLVSRPNAINGRYKKMKLALGTIEEEFPGSFGEKIPVFGKAYKASENAFTAFVYKTRADVADLYLGIAEASGVDLGDANELKSIGKLVNSLTGRGSVGRLEPAANVINNVFWSPRKLKADIDLLTMHSLDKNFSSFAKKQAAKNLIKVIVGTAAILGIAKAIDDDSVDWDPRSANFGKIRIGDTRFDVSAGMASIVTLAVRLITNSSKSSTTGKVTELDSDDYGAITKKDVVYNFMENKLSPLASVVKSLLEGEDYEGNDITAKTILTDLFVPLPIVNAKELSENPRSANVLLGVLADALGIGTNTYSAQSNWSQSGSKEMKQFKEEVGEEKFKQANDKFNNQYNDWLKETINSKEYQKLSNEAKRKLISDGKKEIKEMVMADYGFKYKKKAKTAKEREEEGISERLMPR